ncbi:MAG: T9SS type A sorting domain-containing protein, partial [Bacteroidales bacterium]|nr:T9SS type A sorting domain-containing protein [Bacteroidales bacterium]
GFRAYINWRNELYLNNKSIYALDSTDLDWLITFVSTHTGRGRVLAHNILCGLYDICLEEIFEKSQTVLSGGAYGNAASASAPSAGSVQVFPNPAKEYASFIWDLGSFDGTAQLSITDQNGRQLLTRPLSGAQGQWIWETGSVPSGSYIYSVTIGSLQIESGKIVVAK